MNNKKLKIGCVTSSVSYYGGWDTLSKGIVGAVAKQHDVIALTSMGYKNDPVPYPVYSVLPHHYISFGLGNQISVFWNCIKYFRGCDAIHTFIEPFTPGAAFASKVLGIPLFITLAGTYCVIPKHGGLRGFAKRTMMKFMYNQASFIATGSYKNIELIEEVMSLDKKWEFVPFGVDPEKFKITKTYEPSPYPFLFTVGEVKARKGADYIIKALAILKDEFPDLRYKIAGNDKTKPSFVAGLKKLIVENGLESRVELLGRVSEEDLLRYYSTCTAFVLAAQTIDGAFEGFPMVFYESHSYGAPLIATKGYGSEYVIKDGYNGFLVPQNNVEELVVAIRKIVSNPALRNEMSQHAISEAQKHSWGAISVQYLDAYQRLIK
ncbi:MAG: hypothetical protein A2735_00625 [Candidatus Yanofskybacteria bacterium RIFCSPHIGHO2_01_FULL_41_21]|uniref:Glycosyl transferase family 1 domain-containing protein n=1 Tax=Candidatus Yanofskybacteria bacterium RIFCSPHIGHO2_01_FULL_41_21 TaxID=1802660 RepID=A0A1F8EDN8_9BACT|nr:MAG: hypothetical protein A2735_00625 [Candidatus Yanofskybacteria bacterium RIFCSPHIGHO2_01_FULL_41_21]